MSKQHKSEKILVTIPYWSGDRWQAMLLAKLLADLEPKHSDLADLLLVNRFDCKPFDAAAIKYLSRKFNIYQHRSARRDVGWPQGCNGTFFGALEYIYHMSESGKIPTYKAVLNLGADVVPLIKNWIEYLHHQWAVLPVNLKHPVTSAGALIAGDREHINGDTFLFTGEISFLKWLAKGIGGVKVRAGWDWVLSDEFRARGWGNLPGVHSLWGTPTMPRAVAEEWRKKGAVLIHGVKDDSLLTHARSFLL